MGIRNQKLTVLALCGSVLLLLGSVPEAAAETAKSTKTARVLESRDEGSNVVMHIPAGQTVKVLQREGRWVKIRYRGQVGWVARTSLTVTPSTRESPENEDRKAPFVNGRSTERNTSDKAPEDRVGADYVNASDQNGETQMIVDGEDDRGDEDGSGIEAQAERAPVNTAPLQIGAHARAGYVLMSSTFESDGAGELANYKLSTAAGSLAVAGDVVYRLTPSVHIRGDLGYTGTRATPGIRYQEIDIGFTAHEVNVGVAGGYDLGNAYGIALYGRLGFHFGILQVDSTDMAENPAALPSESLQGVTVGAHVMAARLTEKLGVAAGLDLLAVAGQRSQTEGLEDGSESSVGLTMWGALRGVYHVSNMLGIEASYRLASAKTTWTGSAGRPHNATEANRSDLAHLVSVGAGLVF